VRVVVGGFNVIVVNVILGWWWKWLYW